MNAGRRDRRSTRTDDPTRDAPKVLILYPQIDLDRALAVNRYFGRVLLVLLQSGSISHWISGLSREGTGFCAGHMLINGVSHDVIFARLKVKKNELPIHVGHRRRDAVRTTRIG